MLHQPWALDFLVLLYNKAAEAERFSCNLKFNEVAWELDDAEAAEAADVAEAAAIAIFGSR